MSEALIEAVAREIFLGDGGDPTAWDKVRVRELYLSNARAALAAIEAQGFRVVPVEPTSAMEDAGFALDTSGMVWPAVPDDIWRAMLSASPKLTGGGE